MPSATSPNPTSEGAENAGPWHSEPSPEPTVPCVLISLKKTGGEAMPSDMPDIRPLLLRDLINKGYTPTAANELLDWATAEGQRIRQKREEDWPICPDCGAPVHPDPFYQKAHVDFYTLNPNIIHQKRS